MCSVAARGDALDPPLRHPARVHAASPGIAVGEPLSCDSGGRCERATLARVTRRGVALTRARARAPDGRVAGAADGALDSGYWIDEGIAVGIASHDLADIPRILGQDGNPPLYYLLLHGWMALFGEPARRRRARCRSCSRCWRSRRRSGPGAAVFDRRAGALAAAGAAGSPFLTYYAQETRMYSLVVLLSILASASFALAFVRGERRHVAWLGLWLGLLLYTHTWGLFLAAAMGDRVAGAVAARAGRRARRRVGWPAVLALVYAPWLPSVVSQAAHTAAPWAERPSPLLLLGFPGGAVRLPRAAAAGARRLLRAAAAAAGRSRRARAGRDRGHHRVSLAWLVLADRARVGDALPRRRAGAGAARARLGGLARRALDRAGAGRASRSCG